MCYYIIGGNLEQKAALGTQTQPNKTVKGNYKGWKYEIDAEYEKEFISYIDNHFNFSTIGPGSLKTGAQECFKHIYILEVPDSVKSIEPYTFAECKKLQLIRFNGCELISTHAFRNCENLIYAHFPSAKVIQSYSFYNAGIKSAAFTLFTPEVASLSSNAFYKCGSQVLYFPKLSNLAENSITKCPYLTQLSVPSALTLENGCVVDNYKLESVYAPSLKHANFSQIKNSPNLEHFVISQQAKQILVRNTSEDETLPDYFVSISEYQKDSNKPKRK